MCMKPKLFPMQRQRPQKYHTIVYPQAKNKYVCFLICTHIFLTLKDRSCIFAALMWHFFFDFLYKLYITILNLLSAENRQDLSTINIAGNSPSEMHYFNCLKGNHSELCGLKATQISKQSLEVTTKLEQQIGQTSFVYA